MKKLLGRARKPRTKSCNEWELDDVDGGYGPLRRDAVLVCVIDELHVRLTSVPLFNIARVAHARKKK